MKIEQLRSDPNNWNPSMAYIRLSIFPTTFYNSFGNRVQEWCEENCGGKYEIYATEIRFELEKDAFAFKMRW